MLTYYSRVVIRQPDLDTIVSAFVLGVHPKMELTVVGGLAEATDLEDTRVLCLECGGSGEVWRGNFDHHQAGLDLPPACVQALAIGNTGDSWLEELVAYTEAVDLGLPLKRSGDGPNLSALISGVRIMNSDPANAFWAGLKVLDRVFRLKIDCFGAMPRIEEWEVYFQAREQNFKRLHNDAWHCRYFITEKGLRWGYLESSVPGVHGFLREKGCALSVAATPPTANTGTRKYSIATADLRLDPLLNELTAIEKGWGGPSHGTIIGSPFSGSTMDPDCVLELVRLFAESL